MRLQYLTIPILLCAVLFQASGVDIYLDPTGPSTPTAISCVETPARVPRNCDLLTPCGAPPGATAINISIDNSCNVHIAGASWPVAIVVNASGNGSANFYQWDPLGNSAPIRNLSLTVSSFAAVQVTLSSLNTTESSLTVASRSLTILDSTFRMDNLKAFVLRGVGPSSQLQFKNSKFIKNSGSEPGFSLGMTSDYFELVQIINSTFEMSNFDVFTGSATNVTVDTSTIFGDTFITDIYSHLTISRSKFHGFYNGLQSRNLNWLPAKNFEANNSTFSGLSSIQPISLFPRTGPIQSFRAFNSVFQWGTNPSFYTVAHLELQANTFNNFRQSFNLISNGAYLSTGRVIGNTFTRQEDMQYLVLAAQSTSPIHLSGNQFDATPSLSANCDVSLANIIIDSISDLKIDKLEASNSLIKGSFEASSVNALPQDLQPVNFTGNVVLSSFTGDSSIFFLNNNLTYLITNASTGINTPVEQIARSLHLSWRDPRPLRVGDVWPLFPQASGNAVLPSIRTSDSTFNYTIVSMCENGGRCNISFRVTSVSGCPCHPEHSLPCNNTYVYPCHCIPPWSGPTCEIDSTPQPCPGLPPSPQFYCQNGEYISNSSVTEQTIVIPAGSGTIVVNGNLTSTQTVVFQGLGSVVNVSGCVFVKGNVVVELTPQDVQELLKDGGTKSTGLISSLGGNTCDGSSDLSLVSIVVKSPDKCVKVEASNSGSKQTLSATFTVTQSKCSKSHLVAIIVPSVVGAIVILSVIAVIVFLKIRHDKKM